jgi:hypothetical protein
MKNLKCLRRKNEKAKPFIEVLLVGLLWLFLIMKVGNIVKIMLTFFKPIFSEIGFESQISLFLHYRIEFLSLILIVGFLLLYYKKHTKVRK